MQRWHDRNLVWRPEDFGGINETFLTRDQIWLPEIDIYYSKTEFVTRSWECTTCTVRLTNDGEVLRGYYFVYRFVRIAFCHLRAQFDSFPCAVKENIRYFPFDSHECKMELANWHVDIRSMDLWYAEETVSTFAREMKKDALCSWTCLCFYAMRSGIFSTSL